MSDPHAPAPSHGHPDSTIPSTRDLTGVPATSAHPKSSAPDPTTAVNDGSQGGQSAPPAPGSSQLASAESQQLLTSLKEDLRRSLRQFPDFPSPGILFEDIMPIFASPQSHSNLITALVHQVRLLYPAKKIKCVVGLESRGFLFGPSLALQIGAGFVPVRKQGKLPGKCETVGYKKEYGEDFFQMQSDAFQPGDTVLIVDDIIATGGSAAAAGSLVKKIGGVLLGYLFIMELDFLKGREKLDAPVHTLLSGQEESLKK